MSKKRSSASLHEDASNASVTSPVAAASAATPAEKKQKGASGSPIAKLTRASSSSSSTSTPTSPHHNNLTANASNTPGAALTPAAYSASAVTNASAFKVQTASTFDRGTQLLHVVLPRKVLELDYLATAPAAMNFRHTVDIPYNPDGTFIAGREKDPIPANASVIALINLIKPEIQELIDNIGALKLMIQLRIPAADDGNNFGVEIQEESINELAKVEDVSFSYLEKIHSYYGNRTRIAAKIMKYPAILDYWQSLKELDESFHTDIRLHTIEMRSQYAMIHDLLKKNEEKLNNPRDEDESGKSRRHAFA